MKLAVAGSVAKKTLLTSKGGQEVWTANFCQEQSTRDCTIDLYAVPGSLEIPDKLTVIPNVPDPIDELKNKPVLLESKDRGEDLLRLVSAGYARSLALVKANESHYDIIVDSSGNYIFSSNADLFEKPFIIIGHLPVYRRQYYFLRYKKVPQNVCIVVPSQFQMKELSFIPEDQKVLIQHGVNLDAVRYSAEGGAHMVWAGRIDRTMPKGLPEAIEVAKRLNHPLSIFGNIEQQAYFENEIKPDLTDLTVMKESSDKGVMFGGARLFLYPAQWEEPFGLVLIEALAVGTPVVAYARGSIPEIIRDGETGFIVNASPQDVRGEWVTKKTGIDGIAEAVEHIYALPNEQYLTMRKKCREHVEKKFSLKRMVDQYEELYKRVIK